MFFIFDCPNVNHLKVFLAEHFVILFTTMQEKQRIITVLIVVVVYNLVDQFLIQKHRGINDTSVIISFVIAVVLYLALIYFFGKKHLN